jgi:hypothetical protein
LIIQPGHGTLVVQSHRANALATAWLKTCVDSVQQWADANNASYQFVDDAAFDLLPQHYATKFAGHGAQLSDLARLKLISQAFAAGYEYAVWADADLLIFDPTSLSLPAPDDSIFGVETWVDQAGSNRIRTWRNIHNAFMGFKRNSVVLPYLIYTIESLAARIDPESVAPQTFGPKLLTALNSITGFDTTDLVGAFSEPVLANIASGGGPFLERLVQSQPAVPAAANLCASLSVDPGIMIQVCDALIKKRAPK